ncbi:MAG: M48 family metallopeptidase [Planctomycetes bacterium]|nr:M48 family metallopeptidase [Planctomycetota bacterium]
MNAPSARAQYFDGRNSRSTAVDVTLAEQGALAIRGDGFAFDVPRAALRVGARVGRSTWSVELERGASLAFEAGPDAERLLAALDSSPTTRWIQRLERSGRWAALCVLSLVVVTWLFVKYGVPALAARAAVLVPPDVERAIGAQGLQWIDGWLDPSQLSDDRRSAVEAAFERARTAVPDLTGLRLERRAGGPLRANAFALPGGIVVMTDELAHLVAHDDELVAVFLHEFGHLERHHGMRRLLEGSIVALLSLLLTSDVSTVASVGTGLPAVLLQAGYSRAEEREADAFALDALERIGVPRRALGDVLVRIEAETGSSGIPEILSTHPETSSRVDATRR